MPENVRFTVIEESADDPESNCRRTGLTARQIRGMYPLVAALFPDGEMNSLTFVAELNQLTIRPEYDS